MKRRHFLALAGALVLAVAPGGPPVRARAAKPRPEPGDAVLAGDACTSILVGKDASVDGSVMTTHTCDCGTCDWTWRHVPAADHKPGSTRQIYHISQYKTWPPSEGLKWDLYKKDYAGFDIPEVPHTYAYHHGMFGYMNENQVAIGESSIGNQRKMSEPDALGRTRPDHADPARPWSGPSTAREAIQVMGSLAEKYGYGFHDDGEMLAVSDPNEAWIFEIMPVGPLWTPKSGKPGAVWCAERVPDDEVSVCPNESRIGEIDLANKDFFMASPNVVSLAVEMGYLRPQERQAVQLEEGLFARRKAAPPARNGRHPETVAILRPRRALPEVQARDAQHGPPLFGQARQQALAPGRHGHDPRPELRNAFRPGPGHPRRTVQEPQLLPRRRGSSIDGRAEYTTVTQCRARLPAPIGGIVWISFGSQDTACYMPFYAGMPRNSRNRSAVGDHWTFNRDSARWAFDYTDFHVQVAYSEAITGRPGRPGQVRGGAIARIPEIDGQALALFKKKPAEAAKFLTAFGLNNAKTVIDAWWKLGDDLLVKYNRLYLYDTREADLRAGQAGPPDWWKKAVRVFRHPDGTRQEVSPTDP